MPPSPVPEPDQRLQGLIQRLLQLTQRGTLKWTRGSIGRGIEPFEVNLTESTIRLRSRDNDQLPPYVVQILNGEGILIETIEADSDEEGLMMRELYDIARHQALNVDSVIDSVLRDLNDEEARGQD